MNSGLIVLGLILAQWQTDFPDVKTNQLRFEFSEEMDGVTVIDVNTHLPRLPHGMCIPYENKIKLNAKFWENSDFWQKIKVVYHELGHCALGLDHNTSKSNIMDSNIFTATSLNWPNLVNDLKEQKNAKAKTSL